MAKGKGQNQGHDHSFRQQQKQMLDPRPNNNVKPADDKAQSATTATAAAGGSRVTDLKNWGNEFSIATAPKDQAPAVPAGNSGSAWNRGPPSSLVAKGSSNESTPPPTTNGEEAETKKGIYFLFFSTKMNNFANFQKKLHPQASMWQLHQCKTYRTTRKSIRKTTMFPLLQRMIQ